MLSATNRREGIHHLGLTTGSASVDELSARFQMAASTNRRDLALLNGQGRLPRNCGGAMALGAHPEASRQHRRGISAEVYGGPLRVICTT
ncbi:MULTISPECIES: DeoR family transcriptional regulator [unclassified Arthrobacter]|uniref:DeoR family transcriptional regulator n=1 Tax=unclassified Arthrobacter TaxID=235627 RepID=UPI001CFFC05F|nr:MULTISPECIES: DeoR family transcriptional regulator [unclassified Arthrobacter]WGZ80123.1 DeoR family transcriptional regulator [Arthrobacter sp. EM1]